VKAKSLEAWLAELEQRHPSAIDLGLDRCGEVASRLHLLVPTATTITVAGTNGKGSTVAMMEALLCEQGVSCGAFTSPHLIKYNERIRVNGLEVEDSLIVRAFEAIEAARGEISLTYFEFGALAALWVFYALGVEYQLLEVGLGGRLDAVNIIDADACVITAIGLDHQEWLGNDVDTIAIEKCGIARAGKPCVVADHAAPKTVNESLHRIGAKAIRAGEAYHFTQELFSGLEDQTFSWEIPDGMIPLNAAAAVAALLAVGARVDSKVFKAASKRLRLRGRREHTSVDELSVVMDVAHNPDACHELHGFLRRLPKVHNTVAVFAVMSDKDCRDMIAALDGDIDFWCLPHGVGGERGQSPDELVGYVRGNGQVFETFNESLEFAIARLAGSGRLLIFGSFFTVSAGIAGLRELIATKVGAFDG
jgi:dihydrofolate synthase/folylpolyglutamate synthase